MKRKYGSEMLQVIHEDMMNLHRAGTISDAEMREFDELCLIQEPEAAPPTENPLKTDRAVPASA